MTLRPPAARTALLRRAILYITSGAAVLGISFLDGLVIGDGRYRSPKEYGVI